MCPAGICPMFEYWVMWPGKPGMGAGGGGGGRGDIMPKEKEFDEGPWSKPKFGGETS